MPVNSKADLSRSFVPEKEGYCTSPADIVREWESEPVALVEEGSTTEAVERLGAAIGG